MSSNFSLPELQRAAAYSTAAPLADNPPLPPTAVAALGIATAALPVIATSTPKPASLVEISQSSGEPGAEARVYSRSSAHASISVAALASPRSPSFSRPFLSPTNVNTDSSTSAQAAQKMAEFDEKDSYYAMAEFYEKDSDYAQAALKMAKLAEKDSGHTIDEDIDIDGRQMFMEKWPIGAQEPPPIPNSVDHLNRSDDHYNYRISVIPSPSASPSPPPSPPSLESRVNPVAVNQLSNSSSSAPASATLSTDISLISSSSTSMRFVVVIQNIDPQQLVEQALKLIPENKKKAFELFETAAKLGHVEALFWEGLMYFQGDGIAQDKAKALELFEKAANLGNREAQFHAGVMYFHGDGVAPNKKKARELFEAAAKQGHVGAQFDLGQTSCPLMGRTSHKIWS